MSSFLIVHNTDRYHWPHYQAGKPLPILRLRPVALVRADSPSQALAIAGRGKGNQWQTSESVAARLGKCDRLIPTRGFLLMQPSGYTSKLGIATISFVSILIINFITNLSGIDCPGGFYTPIILKLIQYTNLDLSIACKFSSMTSFILISIVLFSTDLAIKRGDDLPNKILPPLMFVLSSISINCVVWLYF